MTTAQTSTPPAPHTFTRPPTDFVPAALDATKWDQVEPLYKALIARPVSSRADLERWLIDRSELDAACSEAESLLHINMTCDTADQAAQKAYLDFIENIQPRLKPLSFELDKRFVDLVAKYPLDEKRYAVITRDTKAEVELFRPENVPIQTDLAKLSQKYDQIMGAMTVTFDGKEQTLPMMGKYQESTDRSIRESAWRTVADRRLKDREAVDAIYDEMVILRDRMGRNAGFKDFVGYAFKSKRRFDYGVEHCKAFHLACEKAVVPFKRRLDEQRRKALKVDTLRPWDLAVDPKGRPPLKPFTNGPDLIAKSVRTFNLLDPRLGAMLATMGDGANSRGCRDGASLDLDSRKGKAPGGYQAMRDRQRRPFIFMNASGLHRDMETMVHEAGHAFHAMLTVDEPLLHYRGAPLEFCEVASMSMELLTMPHWGGGKDKNGFYPDEADLARARRRQTENAIALLPWIATIDAFQHWVYTHPKHSRAERSAAWLEVEGRFGSAVSWDGLSAQRESLWHRQLHLFGVPFYYIEYGIAQLGALQLWLKSLEDGPKRAIDDYFAGLRLGGSRPLPELFRAAGLKFDFGPDMVQRLVDRVEKELAKLPE